MSESIFHTIKEYFKEKNIPLENIVSVASDGASAMTGCYRGLIALLKKEASEVLSIHCIIPFSI